MAPLLFCEFNMDAACVELKFADGCMLSIDCTAVEDEIADNMYQRSALDYLVRRSRSSLTSWMSWICRRSANL